MQTKPFLRRAEHCMGKVAEAPASPWASTSKAWSAYSTVSLRRGGCERQHRGAVMQRAGLHLATIEPRGVGGLCTYVLLLGHFDGIDQRKLGR